jgi:hypothetical protein
MAVALDEFSKLLTHSHTSTALVLLSTNEDENSWRRALLARISGIWSKRHCDVLIRPRKISQRTVREGKTTAAGF